MHLSIIFKSVCFPTQPLKTELNRIDFLIFLKIKRTDFLFYYYSVCGCTGVVKRDVSLTHLYHYNLFVTLVFLLKSWQFYSIYLSKLFKLCCSYLGLRFFWNLFLHMAWDRIQCLFPLQTHSQFSQHHPFLYG